MSFRRLLGVAAMSAAVAVAFGVQAQDESAQPAPEVTAAPDAEPAAVSELTDAHGEANPGDPAAGQGKAAACAACHGMDGNAVDPQYPKLAGQHEQYIARHLALFKTGERENAIMMGFAAPLSPQDMHDIGAFYAQQQSLPGVADESPIQDGPYAGQRFYEVGEKLYRGGDASRGVPACLACHGPSGRGNPAVPYPAVAGQHARYTADMLRRYRDGAQYGEKANVSNVMAGVAANLTDQEIEALASYIEGLHTARTGALPGSGTASAR